MKNYKAIASATGLCALTLTTASAYAADVSKAEKLAKWAVGKEYSQVAADRNCTSAENKPTGNPGAPPGPPSSTGYCMQYDCSSFITWVLRQVPGITSAGSIKTTYDYWAGSYQRGWDTGREDILKRSDKSSPAGWKPCNGEALCVGFTGWGEDSGAKGPGHVVIKINGTIYSASGGQPWGDGVINSYPEGSQGEVLWFVPR